MERMHRCRMERGLCRRIGRMHHRRVERMHHRWMRRGLYRWIGRRPRCRVGRGVRRRVGGRFRWPRCRCRYRCRCWCRYRGRTTGTHRGRNDPHGIAFPALLDFAQGCGRCQLLAGFLPQNRNKDDGVRICQQHRCIVFVFVRAFGTNGTNKDVFFCFLLVVVVFRLRIGCVSGLLRGGLVGTTTGLVWNRKRIWFFGSWCWLGRRFGSWRRRRRRCLLLLTITVVAVSVIHAVVRGCNQGITTTASAVAVPFDRWIFRQSAPGFDDPLLVIAHALIPEWHAGSGAAFDTKKLPVRSGCHRQEQIVRRPQRRRRCVLVVVHEIMFLDNGTPGGSEARRRRGCRCRSGIGGSVVVADHGDVFRIAGTKSLCRRCRCRSTATATGGACLVDQGTPFRTLSAAAAATCFGESKHGQRFAVGGIVLPEIQPDGMQYWYRYYNRGEFDDHCVGIELAPGRGSVLRMPNHRFDFEFETTTTASVSDVSPCRVSAICGRQD
mmetsp:Transcript_23524/g.49790  ORF Transcript_23524/g.49790 Transcript_23524/m.49790 type:complete len:494 (+) Transcript_23524:1206-2687(+)